MKWWKIFLIVSVGGFIGMVMGGLFGFAAGHMTPDFFERRSGEWGPIGFATVLGGKWGVKLGGGLAVFAVTIQTVQQWLKRGGDGSVPPKP